MFLGWDESDQGKALAWQKEQKAKCDRCGTFDWQHADGPAFVADGFVCAGCATLEVEKARRADSPEEPGVRLVLYPKGPADGS